MFDGGDVSSVNHDCYYYCYVMMNDDGGEKDTW